MSVVETLISQVLPHRHTDARWLQLDCLLGEGERGFNTTNRKWKTGPGRWSTLSYDNDTSGGTPVPTSTDGLSEGVTNRYFTDARADARIAAANLVAKAAVSTAGMAFVDNDPTLAANSATKLATQQAIRAFVTAKFAEFVGVAPAELDTWIEMVAAVQADQGAIAGLTSLINTKATPADITTAITALIAGATGAGNTLKKLEDRIIALAVRLGGAPPVKFNTTTHSWPSRPVDENGVAVSYPVFWVGGDAPVDRPPGMLASDVWFPATGDDIDLGAVLEALQGIAATANTIPYFDAINHAANLGFKLDMADNSDLNLVSQKGTKTYIDTQIATLNNAFAYTSLRTPTIPYSVIASDNTKTLIIDSATSNNLTIPLNSAVPIPVGYCLNLLFVNTGQTTIVKGDSSITFLSDANKVKSNGKGTMIGLLQYAPNAWLIAGSLAA